jgi:hypothetical protein
VGADAQFAKPDLQVLSEKVMELVMLSRQAKYQPKSPVHLTQQREA